MSSEVHVEDEDNAQDIEEETSTNAKKSKKIRLFSGQDFQNKLNTSECSNALKEFLALCKESKNQDVILEYLQTGGSCMQLLHLLERDSTLHPNVVLELMYHIILRVSAQYIQYQSSTFESCQYLLQNFFTLINKTLGLSSSTKDRKITLKLLTALVTFSSNLAKDILVHINLNPGLLDLFIKHTEEKDSVRVAFIHFLMSFLVDGHFPTISSLLEKKGLLASIINGLIYDPADVVCLVLAAMKVNLLENLDYKTMKMKLFNTYVVRDIVNLYNWKGPAGIKKSKSVGHVDEVEKSRVSESVHTFLLTLCTSHKHGVIFTDHLLGLGKKPANALMVTVLEGLEKPWEHSYASDLVLQICAACPDLSRLMWSHVKVYLEPRPTKHWLNGVKFTDSLLKILQPSCIKHCARDLSVHQLAQVIQFLVAPTPIVKMILTDDYTALQPVIKHHVVKIIWRMLYSVNSYLEAAANWLNAEDLAQLKSIIRNHILRNFPESKLLFHEGQNIAEEIPEEFPKYDDLDSLSVIFDVYNLYETLCPSLLNSLLPSIDSKLFMALNAFGTEDDSRRGQLMAKTTNLFLNLDIKMFCPTGELFGLVVALFMNNYYTHKDRSSRDILVKLYTLSGVFEFSEDEIGVWINSIFAVSKHLSTVIEYILEVLKTAASDLIRCTDDLNCLRTQFHDNCGDPNEVDCDNIIELLSEGADKQATKIKRNQINLSPLIVVALKSPVEKKHVKSYLNCVVINLLHMQNDPKLLINIVSSNDQLLSQNVVNYVSSWQNHAVPLEGLKGNCAPFEKISKAILQDEQYSELLKKESDAFNVYPDCKEMFLQECIFCIAQLTNLQELEINHVNNALLLTITLMNLIGDKRKCLQTILNKPVLLRNFSALPKKSQNHKKLCTKYLMGVINEFNNQEWEDLFDDVRDKLYVEIAEVLKKPSKYRMMKCHNVILILDSIGLSAEHCLKILAAADTIEESDFLTDNGELTGIYDILTYSLKRFFHLSTAKKTVLLSKDILKFLNRYLTYLNEKSVNVNAFAALTNSFTEYLKQYPHSIPYLRPTLFCAVLNQKEYCKENAQLGRLLLKISSKHVSAQYLKQLSERTKDICHTKGLFLPLLDAAVDIGAGEEVLQHVYNHTESMIEKTLQKPQKAGSHFENYCTGVLLLVQKFFPVDKCIPYLQKIQKFETTETFHVRMLCEVFSKGLKANWNEKYANNALVSLTHLGISLLKKKMKGQDDFNKIKLVTGIVDAFIKENYCGNSDGVSFSQLCSNETFQLYNKLSLKFGLSGNEELLNLLNTFCEFLDFDDEYAGLLIEMIISHSDFLEVVLGNNKPCKTEVLKLFSTLCTRWPNVRQKNHVPLLLSAYSATWKESDRIILSMLHMYESSSWTYFYNFKPFLWGNSAANYYSVRSDVHKSLFRQSKMSNIMDILYDHWTSLTMAQYPLDAPLMQNPKIFHADLTNVYDHSFMLPLFSYLLAPENNVQTYKFSRSGALSLTVTALSSEDRDVRSAACYVLCRFYNHLEAKQGGNDKLVFLRYVDAVCKGTAALADCKMNNFASIFLSRTASILTQPMHMMYVPLSNYLSAKTVPRLDNVPELYTFLHSSHVNCKEHRHFILELLRDGMRTEHDLLVALKSMAFKLVLELYNSCVCDFESRLLILEMLNRACAIEKGAKYLCNVHGLLAFIYNIVLHLDTTTDRMDNACSAIASGVVRILNTVVKNNESQFFDVHTFGAIVALLLDNWAGEIHEDVIKEFFETVYMLFIKNVCVLNDERLRRIVEVAKCADAEYILNYGREKETRLLLENVFLCENNSKKDKDYFVKVLVFKYLEKACS